MCRDLMYHCYSLIRHAGLYQWVGLRCLNIDIWKYLKYLESPETPAWGWQMKCRTYRRPTSSFRGGWSTCGTQGGTVVYHSVSFRARYIRVSIPEYIPRVSTLSFFHCWELSLECILCISKSCPTGALGKVMCACFSKKIINRLLVSLYEGLTFRHLKGLHYFSSHGLKQLSSLCHAPKLLQAASNHRFIQHMYVMGHVTDWRIRQQNSPHCTSHSPPAQIHAISGQVLYQMKGRLSW